MEQEIWSLFKNMQVYSMQILPSAPCNFFLKEFVQKCSLDIHLSIS